MLEAMMSWETMVNNVLKQCFQKNGSGTVYIPLPEKLPVGLSVKAPECHGK
jgi:hypothetical protein